MLLVPQEQELQALQALVLTVPLVPRELRVQAYLVLLVPLGLVQVEQQVQQALLVLVPLEQLALLAMTEPLAPQVLQAQTALPEQQVLTEPLVQLA